ncbi:MAG: response regulator [Myxococcales bacterium]|jgi:two-component system cell cycle sensor histidine kinase/response regulator CckA
MNRILLVDDEPVILTVLKEFLTGPERELLLAGTAAEALGVAVAASSIEVALVDKNLPDRSGLEVARELKHLHPDAEVILMTAYASIDSAIEAVKVGAFDYISKPITDFDDLVLKVQIAADKVRRKRDQRRLLDQFAESEERYRGAFHGSPDAIIVCCAETGEIRDANEAAEQLYGRSCVELRGLRIQDLRAAPRARGGASSHEEHLRSDGATFPAEVSQGDFVTQGVPMRVLTVRDITERLRLEEERALLDEQLRQAQKMEAIGRLASGVAHDFNNVLTIVLGNAELLLDELGLDDARVERVREIHEASQRAACLTRQLLTFSRKKVAQLESLDLNRVVRDIERMLRRVISENIELVVALDPELWPCRADADQMGQVLLNFAVNARDAMPSGGKLVIETSNVTFDGREGLLQAGLEAGRYVRLAVTDNGCGMDPRVMSRLFEPFFTTKEAGKGTGLGLATVYGIVQQSGGTVRAYSETGEGTTFKVYLPVAGGRMQTEPAPKPVAARKGQGETVLVAEDEPGVRAIIRRVLVRNGYRVLEAGDGLEALSTALGHAGPIDVLVTDLVMPKLSGAELAERLQQVRPNLKILFLSAYPEQAVVEHGRISGPDAFLSKPFNEESLAASVGALFE